MQSQQPIGVFFSGLYGLTTAAGKGLIHLMLFNQTILNMPKAYDQTLGAQTALEFSELDEKTQQFIAGVSGSSSYLRGLFLELQDWFKQAQASNPEDMFDDILSNAISKDGDIAMELRTAKKKVALLLACCDLAEIWPLGIITQKLTEFADFAVNEACKNQINLAVENGVIEADILTQSPFAGLCVIAMGKMGAFELNYSSDIDLIFVFDDSLYPKDSIHDMRAKFVKITRVIFKILNENRADGYVFRTDLRLRPNPSVTPICPAMSTTETYYAKEGRTWERAAFIKARACGGDIPAGQAYLKRLENFVWRKQLDFAAMEDVQNILIQARNHKRVNDPISISGHDIKMGRGGIREIEFFAQTNQLTFGGRDTSVRSPQTLQALKQLVDAERLDPEKATALTQAYVHHRTIEHRIQMLRDAQTHKLPNTPEALEQLACLSGAKTVDSFAKNILAELETTWAHTDVIVAKPIAPSTSQKLSQAQTATIESWQDYTALRTDRAKEIFERLKPVITHKLGQAINADEMLLHFDAFLNRLTSGVQLFSLFAKRPKVLEMVLDICALSRPLAENLAQNTALLDGVADTAHAPPVRNVDAYIELLRDTVSEPQDLEQSLNQIRRWQREEHFRIVVEQISTRLDRTAAERSYSDLAEACITVCVDLVGIEMNRRYGKIQGTDLGILAMGKLGSGEMTCTSDLDIIVVFSGDQDAQSDGKRALDTRSYYAKFTRTLISALSASMIEGKLYEVDMRLRPSGRAGPVATSLPAFEDYQKNKAWVWEHLALSRARVLASSGDIAKHINKIRDDIFDGTADRAKVTQEVNEMIQRLRKEPTANADSLPIKKAKGGLLEIELLAQASTLANTSTATRPRDQLQDAIKAGQIAQVDGDFLIEAHMFLSVIEHLKRLLLQQNFSLEKLSHSARDLFLRETATKDTDELLDVIQTRLHSSAGFVEKYLDHLSIAD